MAAPEGVLCNVLLCSALCFARLIRGWGTFCGQVEVSGAKIECSDPARGVRPLPGRWEWLRPGVLCNVLLGSVLCFARLIRGWGTFCGQVGVSGAKIECSDPARGVRRLPGRWEWLRPGVLCNVLLGSVLSFARLIRGWGTFCGQVEVSGAKIECSDPARGVRPLPGRWEWLRPGVLCNVLLGSVLCFARLIRGWGTFCGQAVVSGAKIECSDPARGVRRLPGRWEWLGPGVLCNVLLGSVLSFARLIRGWGTFCGQVEVSGAKIECSDPARGVRPLPGRWEWLRPGVLCNVLLGSVLCFARLIRGWGTFCGQVEVSGAKIECSDPARGVRPLPGRWEWLRPGVLCNVLLGSVLCFARLIRGWGTFCGQVGVSGAKIECSDRARGVRPLPGGGCGCARGGVV